MITDSIYFSINKIFNKKNQLLWSDFIISLMFWYSISFTYHKWWTFVVKEACFLYFCLKSCNSLSMWRNFEFSTANLSFVFVNDYNRFIILVCSRSYLYLRPCSSWSWRILISACYSSLFFNFSLCYLWTFYRSFWS